MIGEREREEEKEKEEREWQNYRTYMIRVGSIIVCADGIAVVIARVLNAVSTEPVGVFNGDALLHTSGGVASFA